MSVRLAVMGATGLVGQVMRQVLAERNFPYDSIRFLASPRSAGKTVSFLGKDHPVEAATPEAFQQIDIVLSSTPASVSREFSPLAAKAGAVVVDNSSAFRMDPQVPLVVPEVNPEAIARHRGIIANPNCSTIQMVVALKPLHDRFRIRRVVVATYQASSGKGAGALAEFDAQVQHAAAGDAIPPATVHKARLFGNCVPHDWAMGEEGYTEEEWKMMRETRKILGDESVAISVSCVRVPVRVGHGEAINLEFEKPVSADEAREILRSAPGVVLLDDHAQGQVPLAEIVEGRDETFVGRVRRDPSIPNGLNMWVVADNLRKGAATNAIQIAECLIDAKK